MRVGVIGAGAVAMGTAAWLEAQGHGAALWSPSGAGTAALAANGHLAAFHAIAPHVAPGQVAAISSHASFGALALSRLLADRGVAAPVVAWSTTLTSGRRRGPAEVAVSTVRGRIDAAVAPVAEAARKVQGARDLLTSHKDKVRKFYDSGAEIQQMFINQDVVLAHAWSGPISKLIMDGFPVDMTIPKEGGYGFVYGFNVTENAPNADAAYALVDAVLARPEIGAEMTRASGFIATFKGSDAYLSDLEKRAAAFTEDELAGLQFFRAEANEMKYDLLDPAVERIKAA